MKSIYFSRFMPSLNLGGGSRRLMQMLENLEGLSFQLVSSARGDGLKKEQVSRIKAEALCYEDKTIKPELRLWSKKRLTVAYRLGEISRCWRETIPGLDRLDLVFMEDPIYFYPLLEKLVDLHIPVVAICHNLESRVPQQVEQIKRQKALTRELHVLAQCKVAITISQEESHILSKASIPNYFFPYHPPAAIKHNLNKIRRKRNRWYRKTKNEILMIGSAHNPATRQGMERALQYWQAQNYAGEAGKLLVAGYNSEKLFDPSEVTGGVSFLGSLGKKELSKNLLRAKAALCYQEEGAGALTRICEMLMTGVPVLANHHAARSYHGDPGLIEFNDFPSPREITRLIATQAKNFPAPIAPDTQELLDTIRGSIY